MSKVPSSKPRVQCYITEELKAALDRIAAENDASLSETATSALEEFANPNSIAVTLDTEAVEKLKKLSKENYRSVQDQARMIIMEWLKSKTNNPYHPE